MPFHLPHRATFLRRPATVTLSQLLAAVEPYDVRIEPATVDEGALYWRVLGVHHLTPDENRGGHAVFVDVVNEDGQRIDDPNVRVHWGWEGQQPDQISPPRPLDKQPPEPATNVDLFPGQRTWIEVSGPGLPSDRVANLHSAHDDEAGPGGELWNSFGHHSFYILFQRCRQGQSTPNSRPPRNTPATPPVVTRPPHPDPQPPAPDPTPPPVVTPTPAPQAGNRLGFYLHLSTDQFGLWDAIRRIQPPVILIHSDTANRTLLQEIRAFRAPDAFVIGRIYKDVHRQRQMLEGSDPAAAGRAMADEIVHYDFGLATQRGDNDRLLIDAWMSLNEPVPGPASHQFADDPAGTTRLLAAYDAFQVAFQARLQEAGLEGVAFNFGAGNFSRPEHYLDHFPGTLASYTYLGFHEYGWPTLFPAPNSASAGGLYRTCMQGIRAHHGPRHRVIITEAGLTRMFQDPSAGDVGWLNADEPLNEDAYWQSLDWYNAHLGHDDYVLGACLYEVGHHGGWETFRHLGPDRDGQPIALMDRIAALSPGISEETISLEPQTRPQPPINVQGVVTVEDTALEGANVRLVGGQETLGAARGAAAYAPGAVSWTRSITGFAGELVDVWRSLMADGSVPLTWAEFRDDMLAYNPSLRKTNGLLEVERNYFLPEAHDGTAEIVWDRPLTGFAGTVRACWFQYVARKVAGLTYADFKRKVVEQNPGLAESDLRFEAGRRYNLPRNAGQKEYCLVTTTSKSGRFRFANLPPGSYRLEVSVDCFRQFVVAVDAQDDQTITCSLQPLSADSAEPEAESTGAAGGPNFVRIAGNEFVVGRQILRFVGVNIRGLAHYGDGQSLPHATRDHQREQIRAARDLGVRVIRIFLPSVHANLQEMERRLRDLLNLLREEAPEIYLLPALSNLYNDVPFRVPGDDGFYAPLDPNFGGDLLNRDFFAGGYRNNYWPLVRHIVSAFRDEPSIFAWEIGNELKLNPATGPVDTDPHINDFLNFMHETAAELRRLDPNHLVTTGMISTHHAWLHTETLRRRLYAGDSFDFLTMHCYNDELHNDESALAASLNKPFIVEEAGYGLHIGADRSQKLAEDMERWYSRRARGYMPWGFMATGQDIGDGDRDSGIDRTLHADWVPMTDLLRRRAQRLLQETPNLPIDVPPADIVSPTRPAPPADTQFAIGQTVFSQTWVNVRRSAGHLNKLGDDILGMLAPGAPVTIEGAAVEQDGLTWWPVRGISSEGAPLAGWAAASTAGTVLLSAQPDEIPTEAVPTDSAVEQARYAHAYLNLRQDPGYIGKPSDHVIGQVPYGAKVTLLGDATDADALTWWPVRAPLLDNRVATGWVAEVDPNGVRLLAETAPPPVPDSSQPPPGQGIGPPLHLGDTLVILVPVNVRDAARISGNAPGQVLATLLAGEQVTVVDGPQVADDLQWWRVAQAPAGTGDGSSSAAGVTGWIAMVAPDGTRLVAAEAVAACLHVALPVAGGWSITQSWGANPQVYSQFFYDGVALRGHNGLDYGTPVGTPILAVDDARVARVDFDPNGFGHYMLLEHAWGESIYAHLARVDVAQGATVLRGQSLGQTGNSGFSTGPHLHFGLRIFPYRRGDGWGGFINPTPLLLNQELRFTQPTAVARQGLGPELRGLSRP